MTAGVDLPPLAFTTEQVGEDCSRCTARGRRSVGAELGWYDRRVHMRCPYCGHTWFNRDDERDPLPVLGHYITAAWVRVGQSPEVVKLPPADAPFHLETLQGLVGGYIECLRDIWPGVDAWANDEGRNIQLPPNRFVRASDGRRDWGEVVGNIVIGRHDNMGGMVSLTRDDLRRVAWVFRL